MDTSLTSKTIEKVKDFYYNDNNKGTKMALVLIGGSLLVYAVYMYSTQSSKVRDSDATRLTEPYAIESGSNAQEEKAPDLAEQQAADRRLKEKEAAKERARAAKQEKKKNQKQIDELIEFYLNEGCKLIADGKGWNIKLFVRYYVEDNIKFGKADLMKFECKQCGNICRDLVEVEEAATDDSKDDETGKLPVMCEVCAKAEQKKYSVSATAKAMRKMILKESIMLPDPANPEAFLSKNLFWGALSKAINTKIPKLAEEEVARGAKGSDEASWRNLMKFGESKPLDWKFHDDSNTKDALFLISDDGLTATSNKRSGTILLGPFIRSKYYAGGGKREKDLAYFGNVFTVELKMTEAEGCGVGFCTPEFGQWVGKNEAQVNSMMVNQAGWFYTSSIFKHEWEHARETPMGKWFKSDDTIVVAVDCTDADNVKAQIYNKANAENKFEIENLPQQIAIAVNIIVGSNPSGTVQPAVSIISAKTERRVQ